MSYNYIVDHIPKTTKCNRRPGIAMTAEYITVHSTGNPNSKAVNERAWLTNPSNNATASFHIVVDETTAIECIPLNEVAWHAGDGNGKGNRASISIEICESGDRAKTVENATLLIAKMLHKRGWGIDRVKKHQDWSGKYCPRILIPQWDGFIASVERELKKLKNTKEVPQWQKDALKALVEKGIIETPEYWEKKLAENITVGEVMGIIAKIVK